MAHVLEIPDPVYIALEATAEKSGKSPVEWIADQVARSRPDFPSEAGNPREARSLADLMAGRIGRVRSGGESRLSESCGETFTDHLEVKRREGRL